MGSRGAVVEWCWRKENIKIPPQPSNSLLGGGYLIKGDARTDRDAADGPSFRPIERPQIICFKMKLVCEGAARLELSEEENRSRPAADSAALVGGGWGRAADVCVSVCVCVCLYVPPAPHRPSPALAACGSPKGRGRGSAAVCGS